MIVKLSVVLGLALFTAGLFAAVYLGVRRLPLTQRTVTINTTLPVRTMTLPVKTVTVK